MQIYAKIVSHFRFRKFSNKISRYISEGDEISVSAESDKQLRFMFCSAKPLKEPVSWGGPIVMNTREELNEAFKELDKGTFIKHNAAHLD